MGWSRTAPAPHPGTLSLPPSGNSPKHQLGKPLSLPPSPDCRLTPRGQLTHMPQRQDDRVETTLGNQAPNSCPTERQKHWCKQSFSAGLQRRPSALP